MKNKKSIYILLPAVLIIWGIIGYKIFSSMNVDQTPSFSQNQSSFSEPDFSPNSDTFSLLKNYHDPFLKNQPVKIRDSKSINPNVRKINVQKEFKWQTINYLGMVKGKQSKKELALIEIDGEEYMVKKGDTLEGLKISKIYKDSIELQAGKVRKYFLK